MFTIKPLEWTLKHLSEDYTLHVPMNCAVRISIEETSKGCSASKLFTGPNALAQAKADVERLHRAKLMEYIQPTQEAA